MDPTDGEYAKLASAIAVEPAPAAEFGKNGGATVANLPPNAGYPAPGYPPVGYAAPYQQSVPLGYTPQYAQGPPVGYATYEGW